jgi:hypothetical protein
VTTFVDADRAADSTGTPLASLPIPAVDCQSGDWYIVVAKWEGATGSTCSLSANQTTSQAGATAVLDQTSTGDDLHGRMFYGQIDSGSSVVLTANFSPSRPYIGLDGYVFRPAGGQVLVFDAAATSTQGGSDNSPATGATSNAGAGAAVAGFALYNTLGLTEGSGWTDQLNADASHQSEYRLLSGAGSITGNGTLSGTTFWIAMMVILKEQAGVGGTYNAVPQLDHYYRMISG